MIYTLTFNPSLDYIVSLEDFELGKVNRTASETIYPGGKGINVSIVLSNLGIDTSILGFYAGYIGRDIVELLDDMDLNHDMIEVKNGLSRINVKIRAKSEKQGQEETEINGMGPVIKEQDLDKLYEKLDKLKEGDYLVLAGSVPPSIKQDIYQDIFVRLKGKGINIAVDASKDLLTNIISYGPFVIKPNNHELEEIFGEKITSRVDAIKYAKVLREKGAKNVIVSMGEKGAVLVTNTDRVYEMDAPRSKVVNCVGAGDSMLAAFLYGYIETRDYEKAFRYGISAGSATAFSQGLATREDIEEIYNKL